MKDFLLIVILGSLALMTFSFAFAFAFGLGHGIKKALKGEVTLTEPKRVEKKIILSRDEVSDLLYSLDICFEDIDLGGDPDDKILFKRLKLIEEKLSAFLRGE